MKYYEIKEILDQIDDRAIKKALSKGHVNLDETYYATFANDKMINPEIIKYLAGEYYLASLSDCNRQYIRNFIEKNYRNDDRLYAAFMQNSNFSRPLIANYINNDMKFDRSENILKIKRERKLHIALSLNPYMITQDQFQYVTDEINFLVKNFVCNIMDITDFNYKYSKQFQELMSYLPETFIRCLLGNAYKLSIFKKPCYIKTNNDISTIMNDNNYDSIKELLLNDEEFFMKVCHNTFEYYYLPNDVLEKMNLLILKDNKVKNQLKEFNPLYLVELISDIDFTNQQKKKNRK